MSCGSREESIAVKVSLRCFLFKCNCYVYFPHGFVSFRPGHVSSVSFCWIRVRRAASNLPAEEPFIIQRAEEESPRKFNTRNVDFENEASDQNF